MQLYEKTIMYCVRQTHVHCVFRSHIQIRTHTVTFTLHTHTAIEWRINWPSNTVNESLDFCGQEVNMTKQLFFLLLFKEYTQNERIRQRALRNPCMDLAYFLRVKILHRNKFLCNPIYRVFCFLLVTFIKIYFILIKVLMSISTEPILPPCFLLSIQLKLN